MKLALVRSSVLSLLGACILVFSLGCQPKLPGPLECEKMAVRGMGVSLREIDGSALAANVVTVVTQSCITTPFDHEAVRCVELGHGLRRCSGELAQRSPSRKAALEEMIRRISQLDRHGRALK